MLGIDAPVNAGSFSTGSWMGEAAVVNTVNVSPLNADDGSGNPMIGSLIRPLPSKAEM